MRAAPTTERPPRWALALCVLLPAVARAEPCPLTLTSSGAEERGLLLGSAGLDLLSKGELAPAIDCLEQAHRALPGSAVVMRDLATAYLQAGRLERAAELADRALAAGDLDPEVQQLRALALAELGREEEAQAIAAAARGWEAALVAAALGDRGSALGAADLAEEQTSRGALAALVLAASAGAAGETSGARVLLAAAEAHAEHADEPLVLNTARTLGQRLGDLDGPSGALRLRAGLDHTSNPLYEPRGTRGAETGLRLAVRADGSLSVPVGLARVQAAARVDQRLYVSARQRFHELDVTGLALVLAAELPIGTGPRAAYAGVRARVSDVFGDLLRVHYATTVEGGPSLSLPFTAESRLELGFYGVATDVIDKSPADAKVSSLNRDFVGQRAAASLWFTGDHVGGRADFVFLREAALGEAFDARGGAVAARLWASPSDGVALSVGGALTVREYGPVGDAAIIGPAATRIEVRTALELGARVEVAPHLDLLIEDVWIRSNARTGHDFVDNVLSLALEQSW